MRNFRVTKYLDNALQNNPYNIAVIDGSDSITYFDLHRKSNDLAGILTDIGVSPQDKVIFCLKRSVNCIISILGILNADAVYVPVDPKTPILRLKLIIEDCNPSTIICDSTTLNKILHVVDLCGKIINIINIKQNRTSGNIEMLLIEQNKKNKYNLKAQTHSGYGKDLAYVIYTSGSTGPPKGVMISHRNIHSYINWAVEYFSIKSKDVILGTAPFNFDMSTFDVYASLKAGSTLCIAEESMILFPEKLMTFIELNKATIWKVISSLMMYIDQFGALKEERMTSLEKIIFAGETLPTKYLIRWMDTYPLKIFYNAYGPTEATGVSICYRIENKPLKATEKIPIGVPRKETNIYILREDESIAGDGEVGELCISGEGLSPGYLNDPYKTNNSFIRSLAFENEVIYKTGDLALLREDGNYEFVGRKDGQVKIRGYRIELGEIERSLISIDGIIDAAVVVLQRFEDSNKELCGYYTSNKLLDSDYIKYELSKKIPFYMIPKQIIKTERIPRNDRGKIDREQLIIFASTL